MTTFPLPPPPIFVSMPTMNKLNTSLHLQDLELHVHLGWPDEERAQLQSIWMTIDIEFPSPPKACENDVLDDTMCYDKLIKDLRKQIESTSFRLIEKLGSEAYHLIKKALPQNALVKLAITKHPQIDKLHRGVTFCFGDPSC